MVRCIGQHDSLNWETRKKSEDEQEASELLRLGGRRSFLEEFKRDAVQMMLDGHPVQSLAGPGRAAGLESVGDPR